MTNFVQCEDQHRIIIHINFVLVDLKSQKPQAKFQDYQNSGSEEEYLKVKALIGKALSEKIFEENKWLYACI